MGRRATAREGRVACGRRSEQSNTASDARKDPVEGRARAGKRIFERSECRAAWSARAAGRRGEKVRMSGFSVVIPTLGRSSLQRCLDALAAAEGPLPDRVIVVDDRLGDPGDLPLRVPERFAGLLVVLRSGGRGPAAARNLGWRAAPSEWVAFLDDDVIPFRTWRADLVRDLDAAGQDDRVAGVQGRIRVPLPPGRRPTDWERATAGLATARWITADMAYRCLALRSVDGFDERFRRAFR